MSNPRGLWREWRTWVSVERDAGRTDHPGSGYSRSYDHRDVEAARYWRASRSISQQRHMGREIARTHGPGWVVHTAEGVSWVPPDALVVEGCGWAIPIHVDCELVGCPT